MHPLGSVRLDFGGFQEEPFRRFVGVGTLVACGSDLELRSAKIHEEFLLKVNAKVHTELNHVYTLVIWKEEEQKLSGKREMLSCDPEVLPTYSMSECMPIAQPPLEYELEKPGSAGLGLRLRPSCQSLTNYLSFSCFQTKKQASPGRIMHFRERVRYAQQEAS